jgi:hypothetical protein
MVNDAVAQLSPEVARQVQLTGRRDEELRTAVFSAKITARK